MASGNVAEWRQRTSVFEGICGYYTTGRTVSLGDSAEALITAQVSADFFDLMRVSPILGRMFTAEETARAEFNTAAAPIGADPVVILSHGFWLRHFGGDPNAIGQSVVLERRPFRVVGVMPAGFAVPERRVALWIPWHISIESPRDQHFLGAIARVKNGVSLAQAEEQLAAVAGDLGDLYPDTNRGWGIALSPLAVETVGGAAAVLWVLLAAVGLVLLVACANVALLTLMRGLDRQDEVAIRIALGASSGRLIREFLLESVLLSLAGGTLGGVIALAGLQWLPAIAADLPRIEEVAFDVRSMAFITAVTIMTAVLSGLPQAWRRTRVTAITGLTSATLRATQGRGHASPPRRDRDRAGRNGGDPDGGIGVAGPQLSAAALNGARFRSPRCARGADLSRQPSVQLRRADQDVLPDAVRTARRHPGRDFGRRCHHRADQPAWYRLRAAGLAERSRQRERRAGAGLSPDDHTGLHQDAWPGAG